MNLLRTRGPRPYPLLFLLLLMLGDAVPATAQRSTESLDFPDGKPKLHRELLNGRADGLWLEWYPNGELRYRAWWKDGLGYGKWEYFFENGQLRSETVYVRDQPTGMERAFHPNGAPAAETVYVDGKRHGVARTFDERGTLLTEQLWLEGEQVLNRPVLFAPGVISTPENNEWSLSFTPDGQTVYFTRRGLEATQQKIYRSDLQDGEWTEPVVAPFSTDTDEGAHLSPDGEWFYFASFRPIPGRPGGGDYDMNLWRMPRAGAGWGTPEPLPAAINGIKTASDAWPYRYEAGPMTDADGNLYYWTGLEAGSAADVVVARKRADGTFGAPTAVAGINGPGSDSGPALSPDGQLLCFSSYTREGSFGQEDLYCARKTATGWGEPVNLGPLINGVGNEGGARFSPDGKYFYFTSDRGAGGQSEIYYMESAYVPFPRSGSGK